MGFSVLKIRENYNNAGHKEWLIDSDDELDSIPVDICPPGSEAYSAESGTRWILGNDKEWKEKVNTGGGGSGDGQDGVSPTIAVTDITGGHRLTITDVNGTTTVDVMDGTDGDPGEDGGYYTPSVSEAGVLSWTASKSGMPSVADANVKGTPGTDGDPAGFGTPTATVDSNVGTPGVAITASGPDTAKVFSFAFTNLKGAPGTPGTDGTTFTPAVSSAGVISWSNDGGKTNPQSVDLAAPVIQAVKPIVTNVTGTTPSIALADNTIFSAGTLTSLTVTGSLNESQIAVIVFTSGSTATQLTIPSSIKMPDSFAVEANKTYEISIMGSRGAVQSWT